MPASFLLALREGMEAALIIGIIIGALVKLHYSRLLPAVWLGSLAALLLSLLAYLGYLVIIFFVLRLMAAPPAKRLASQVSVQK